MLTARNIVKMFAVALVVLEAGLVYGQDPAAGSGQAFPNKTIRIVTAGPGGGTDFVARLIAQEISEPLGQTIIIENRPGGIIPGHIVAQALPDGYTLLAGGTNVWVGTLLRKTPFDTLRDFSAVSLTDKSPNILVVNSSLPAKSVTELIALAKAKPGALNYGSSNVGGSNHLMAELFKSMAGVNIVNVYYKTTPAALTDLISNQVQMMFSGGASAIPHVKTGKLRALAVTSAKPTTLYPDLPTIAATGLPGYDAEGIAGLFAPAKTPEVVINRLNREIVRVLNKPDVKERLLNSGTEAVSSSPREFAAMLKSDIAKWAKVIKDAGIKGE